MCGGSREFGCTVAIPLVPKIEAIPNSCWQQFLGRSNRCSKWGVAREVGSKPTPHAMRPTTIGELFSVPSITIHHHHTAPLCPPPPPQQHPLPTWMRVYRDPCRYEMSYLHESEEVSSSSPSCSSSRYGNASTSSSPSKLSLSQVEALHMALVVRIDADASLAQQAFHCENCENFSPSLDLLFAGVMLSFLALSYSHGATSHVDGVFSRSVHASE